DLAVLWALLFDTGQLALLHVVAHSHPRHAVGLAALLQRRIVQFLTASQDPLQAGGLRTRGIQAIAVRPADLDVAMLPRAAYTTLTGNFEDRSAVLIPPVASGPWQHDHFLPRRKPLPRTAV